MRSLDLIYAVSAWRQAEEVFGALAVARALPAADLEPAVAVALRSGQLELPHARALIAALRAVAAAGSTRQAFADDDAEVEQLASQSREIERRRRELFARDPESAPLRLRLLALGSRRDELERALRETQGELEAIATAVERAEQIRRELFP